MNDDPTFSIHELVAEFHLAPATIHWYVLKGILPKPTRGPNARHPRETWTRLDDLRRNRERYRRIADWEEKYKSPASTSTNGTDASASGTNS